MSDITERLRQSTWNVDWCEEAAAEIDALRRQLAAEREAHDEAVDVLRGELVATRQQLADRTTECQRLSEALSASIEDYNRMTVAYQEAAKQAELNRLSCELKTEYLAKETAARSKAEAALEAERAAHINEAAHHEALHEEYKRACEERDAERAKRCGTWAYTISAESAGKKGCEKLERFVSLQFGCADWRAKDGAK